MEQNARADLEIADRGYVLEAGRLSLAGSAAELLANPSLGEAYLGSDAQTNPDDNLGPHGQTDNGCPATQTEPLAAPVDDAEPGPLAEMVQPALLE